MALHSQRHINRSRHSARRRGGFLATIGRVLVAVGLSSGALVGVALGTQSAASAAGPNFVAIDGNMRFTASSGGEFDWANSGSGAANDCSTSPAGAVNLPGTNGLYNCGAPNGTGVPFPPKYIGPANVLAQTFLTTPDGNTVPGCGSGAGTYDFPGSQVFNEGLSKMSYGFTTNVPQKDALADAYVVSRINSAGHVEVYFGAQRTSSNGDSHVDFQFLQDPKAGATGTCSGGFTGSREQGDILVEVNYVQGGSVTAPAVYTWVCATPSSVGTKCDTTGDWKQNTSITTADAVQDSNANPVPCGGWVCQNMIQTASGPAVDQHEFVEGALDLGSQNFNFGVGCGSSALVETRTSGQSGTSQLATLAKPVAFATCAQTTTHTTPSSTSFVIGGSLTDHATVTGDATKGAPGGTVTFSYCYSATQTITSCDPSSGTLVPGTNPVSLQSSGATTSTATSPSFTPAAPGSYCFAAVYNPTAGNFYSPSVDGNSNECFTVQPITPKISLVKTGSIKSFSEPGVPVTYSYLVTNTGNVNLDPVTVTDPMTGLSAISCPDTSLTPGQFETCTATYTTTQTDVDAGSISNIGTATGTPPSGPSVTATSPLTIPAVQGPAISLVKSASISSFSAPGTKVTYSYLATNTGNVTLDPVTVTDPMSGLSALSCPQAMLAPGGSETCTATYTTTQADVDHGSIHNIGTATGTPPSGPKVTATSPVVVTADQTPGISLKKSADQTSLSGTGANVTYSYLVTNTGNVTLDPVAVTDPMSGLSAISCPDTSLSPGQSETCTAKYTTTSADVTAGSIKNTGTATGTPPSGTPVTASSSLVIPVTSIATAPLVQTTTTVPATTTTTKAPAHQVLAFTGLNARTLAELAIVLVGGGTVLVLIGRRRRSNEN